MNHSDEIIARLCAQKLLPLFYEADPIIAGEITRAFYRAGIRAIEFTDRGPAALQVFTALVELKKESMPDLLLGVGTIRSTAQAGIFHEAGADFLISPVFDASLASWAKDHQVFWIPGCCTPTELHLAEVAGCRFVKLFPGSLLGPSFVSAIRPLFPGMLLMPTGGVETSEENLQQWFRAGVSVVGMGSNLVGTDLVKSRSFDILESRTIAVLRTIQQLSPTA